MAALELAAVTVDPPTHEEFRKARGVEEAS